MYKLTVYIKNQDILLPVHLFYSEDRSDLESRSRHLMSLNDSYVSILITYRVDSVEVLKMGEYANDGHNQ